MKALITAAEAVNGNKIPAALLVLALAVGAAWWDMKGTIKLMALNQAVIGCEVAEIRTHLQKAEPFTNECYKLITDEVVRRSRGLQ